MEYQVNNSKIVLKQGDITKQSTDCIVNAANSNLAHGGGVARAIANAAGPKLQEASRKAPHVPTGQVHTTPAGNLPAKWVIHAVGPIWKDGNANEEENLRSAIRNSMIEADRLKVGSISFPAISTGIYGFPLKSAANIMLDAAIEYLETETDLELVQFVLFSESDYTSFVEVLESKP